MCAGLECGDLGDVAGQGQGGVKIRDLFICSDYYFVSNIELY